MRIAPLFLCIAALAASNPEKELKPRLPALSSVFPQGSEPGRTLEVEILGEYLDRAQSVIFLDSSIRGKVFSGSYTRLTLEFSIDAAAPLGPHYFRIISPRGASNVLLFRVGDQPHVLEKEPNSTFEEAQEVSMPVTINGRLNVDGDFDFFRFHAVRGQSWIFDLRSARNGNGLDPALILLDWRRRKLAHSEDAFIWDPFIRYTFSETGDYYAIVQPTHARLDPNFAYQLDIRMAPHLETISPISMRPGATTDATVFGAGLNGGGARLWFDERGFAGEVLEMRGDTARVKVRCPDDAREGPRQLVVITDGGHSNPAVFLVDATPVHSGGDQIRPPVSITGIARYRQPERFWFEAKENEALVFEVRAQRFGSPVDSILRILDESGKQIAMNDDASFPGAQFNKDSYIQQTFAKGGRYQVEMRNLWKTTGEDFPYQLVVRPPRPDFDLMLASDNPYEKLKITAARKEGFKGPIPITVQGLPTVMDAVIAAEKNEIEIPLPAGETRQIRVVSGAKVAWRSVRISSGGGEGATFATVDQATVAAAEKPLFELEAVASNVNLVRGGTAEFEVMIRRAEGFREPIEFLFENLPNGVTAGEVTAQPDSGRVKIHLHAARDAQPGRFSRLAILGRAAGGQVQEAPKIAVIID